MSDARLLLVEHIKGTGDSEWIIMSEDDLANQLEGALRDIESSEDFQSCRPLEEAEARAHLDGRLTVVPPAGSLDPATLEITD
jgi:hypothetical protein